MLRTCLSGSNKRLIRQWLSHPIPSYLTVNAFTTPQSRQNLAFSSYRNQSSILQSTKEAIDLLNSTSESSSVRKFDTSGDKTEFDLKYPFQENFDMTQGNIDIYDVKEGGYISLNESDLKRYLPELKQTTLSSEFNLTQSKNMMIRDVNKVLCKLVDTYDKNRQVDGKQNVKSPQTAGYANNLPFFGLSNRPEWPTAKLNTYYYGKLLSIPTKHIEPPIVAIKGPESKQDKIVSMILDENEKKIPQKVLLSGKRCFHIFKTHLTVLYALFQVHVVRGRVSPLPIQFSMLESEDGLLCTFQTDGIMSNQVHSLNLLISL